MSEDDVPARRIAVVTGGSKGIGLSIVESLLGANYRVAFLASSPESVEQAYQKLKAQYAEEYIHAKTVNLRDADAISRFFAEVRERWAAPDTLVCNAGISPKGINGDRVPFAEVKAEEWNDVFAVNFNAAVHCCQISLPQMAAGGFGRIVIIGSIATRALPFIAGSAYIASKSALSGLMRAIVSEYSARGITTNIIAPGLILTEMAGSPEEPKNQLALKRIPAAQYGVPADIARVATFLADEASHFINGTTIDVNGGEYIAP